MGSQSVAEAFPDGTLPFDRNLISTPWCSARHTENPGAWPALFGSRIAIEDGGGWEPFFFVFFSQPPARFPSQERLAAVSTYTAGTAYS